MLVLLFDIDGTLISTGGAGVAALQAAMREAFGVERPAEVPVGGRTDRGIARSLFDAHSLENSTDNWSRFRDAYLKNLARFLPESAGRVLPGVAPLLDAVARRERVLVGLLTGNVREGARLKLEHYRLASYFEFGGFGDRHADRNDVAAEALEESHRQAARLGTRPTDVWVIGDTPLDVACARSIGARAIAVATGAARRDALQAARPDVLVEDLSDHQQLLNEFGLT